MKVTPIEAALLDEIDRERARGTRFVMVILVISLLALASLALMFSSAWSEREQEREMLRNVLEQADAYVTTPGTDTFEDLRLAIFATKEAR